MGETLAIKDGIIVTVDEQDRVYANGCVIMEDDRVVDVGKMDDVYHKYRKDRVIDAKRQVVLPGFVNLHCHSGLIRGTAEDLSISDWLRKYVDPSHRVLTSDDAYAAAMLTYVECVKAGITSVLDMYRFMHRCADAAEKVGLRVTLAPYVSDKFDYFEKPEDNYRLVAERDGSARGRIHAWIGMEHIMYCTEEAFRKGAEQAEKYRVGIHTHGEESSEMADKITKEYGKRPTKVLKDYGILGPRTVLAHCVWLDDSEINLLAETGTSVAHCPVSNLKLASGIARVPEMRRAGIMVGLGSDGLAENNRIDIMQEMKFAGLIQKAKHYDATLMPSNTLLRMATVDGARALGLNNEIGSIERGKKADLVLIDLNQPHVTSVLFGEFFNVVNHIAYAAHGGDVRTVIVDGRVILEKRRFLEIDEQMVIDRATEATRGLLERRKPFVPT